LRPAVSKELYQLHPKVSASCVFVVSRVVNRTRMSCIERYGNAKCPTILRSFSVLLYVTLYTILWARTELLNDIDNAQFLYHGKSNVQNLLKKFGEDDRNIMFLISPISSYCYDLMKILSPERVVMQ
jgi:hypothetical protein